MMRRKMESRIMNTISTVDVNILFEGSSLRNELEIKRRCGMME